MIEWMRLMNRAKTFGAMLIAYVYYIMLDQSSTGYVIGDVLLVASLNK